MTEQTLEFRFRGCLVGASGILGSALFDHFSVCYSPRAGRLTLSKLGRGDG